MSTTKTDIVLNICCAMIINENTKPPLLAKHLKIKHPEHKDKHVCFSKLCLKPYNIQSTSFNISQHSLNITNK